MKVSDAERELIELVRSRESFSVTVMMTPDGEMMVDTSAGDVADVRNHRTGAGFSFDEAWCGRKALAGMLLLNVAAHS